MNKGILKSYNEKKKQQTGFNQCHMKYMMRRTFECSERTNENKIIGTIMMLKVIAVSHMTKANDCLNSFDQVVLLKIH